MAKNITLKPATSKYVKFAEKQMGVVLTGKPTWLDVYDVLCRDFEASMYTHCKKNGDNTTYSLYRSKTEGDADSPEESLINKFDWKNEDAFIESEGDWNWNFIYKEVVIWLEANKKTVYKKMKVKKVTKKQIKEQMALLKKEIKAAGADLRRKLIDEYNELAKKLDE